MPLVWVVILRLLNVPNTLLWHTCYFEWYGECDFVGSLESPIGLDSLVDPLAPRCLLKISRIYNLSVLQLRAGLLILIWMASLSSLVTCLLSWYIILKWEILALWWLLDTLHWQIALVMGPLCSLTLFFKHFLDLTVWERLQCSSGQDHF